MCLGPRQIVTYKYIYIIYEKQHIEIIFEAIAKAIEVLQLEDHQQNL